MKIVIAIVVLLVGIQFIPVGIENKPYDAKDSLEVAQPAKGVLQRACYDCHSYETTKTIYSSIAPFSWGVKRHIDRGRDALNFSTWHQMDPYIKQRRIDRMYRVVELGFMPKYSYTLFHPETKLSSEDKKILKKWAQGL